MDTHNTDIPQDMLRYWEHIGYEPSLYDWCTIVINDYKRTLEDRMKEIADIAESLKGKEKKEIQEYLKKTKRECSILKKKDDRYIYELYIYSKDEKDYIPAGYFYDFKTAYKSAMNRKEASHISRDWILKDSINGWPHIHEGEGFFCFNEKGIMENYCYFYDEPEIYHYDPDSFEEREIHYPVKQDSISFINFKVNI